MKLSTRQRVVALGVGGLLALLLVAGSGAFVYVSNRDAIEAAASYNQALRTLRGDLAEASRRGFTGEDLQPVSSRLPVLNQTTPPFWFGDRADFYGRQAGQARQLDADLRSLEAELSKAAQRDAGQQLQAVSAAVDHARQAGVVDADLAPLQQRLATLTQAAGAAQTVGEYRAVSRQAAALQRDVTAASTAQDAENAAVQQAAAALKAQTGGNLDAIHQAGLAAVANGRNDASIAYYLNQPSPFKDFAALSEAYDRLERYAPQVGSPDLDVAAIASAAVQRYADQVHNDLVAGLPAKVIIVSHAQQQLWAIDAGRVVQSTPVTTGRPELPTDIGPMKVLSKSSPWTMHSPWPKSSPWWYPDTTVQMVLWFTDTGEGLHDAAWETCCYGAGSEYNEAVASHGCIHVPFASEQFLFGWAAVGTPVVVYWGDGSPVQSQLAQVTTDNNGHPLTGPKGA